MNNDLLQSLKAIVYPSNSVTLLTQTATLTIAKSAAGFLHAVDIGSASTPTLTLYDNASGASGTILRHFDVNAPIGNYVVDLSFSSGVTAWITGGNATRINLSTR